METIKPIVAEAARKCFDNACVNPPSLECMEGIIKAAIEKATENCKECLAACERDRTKLAAELKEAQGAYKAEIKSHQRTNDLLKIAAKNATSGDHLAAALKATIEDAETLLGSNQCPAPENELGDSSGDTSRTAHASEQGEETKWLKIWKQANIVCALSGAVAHDCDHYGITRPKWWKSVQKLQKLINATDAHNATLCGEDTRRLNWVLQDISEYNPSNLPTTRESIDAAMRKET